MKYFYIKKLVWKYNYNLLLESKSYKINVLL